MRPRSSALVDKVSGALSSRFGRRGFFARAAVVGTALAVDPKNYALTPIDAYSLACTCYGQSCDCGSLCCSGYTEFCCTLTGYNTCPAGTLLGGWWKVDGTGFCSGPRYYLDCNAPCNGCGCGSNGVCSGSCSGTTCGCANGDCNNRKAGCVNFRYGQCNQQIACIGPIVCRIATCIAPWQIDGTCTTAPRYDAATAYHDRACLHRVIGDINVATNAERDGQSGIRLEGWAIDFDTNGPIRVHVYVDGAFVAEAVADVSRPDVAWYFPGMGPNHGFDVFVPAAPGSRNVCVYGINAGYDGSGNPPIGCRTVQVAGRPFGVLDAWSKDFDSVTVEGWAIDPDTTAPIEVRVRVDGSVAATATADLVRDDVAQVYPQYGNRHGFRVTVQVPGGRHDVCVEALNVGPPASNAQLGCFSVVMGAPIGELDVVEALPGGALISGWAIDTDALDAPVTVRAEIDGQVVGEGLADRPRPDVAARYPDAGADHGFTFEASARPGTRVVRITAADTNGEFDTVIGERTVSVPTGTAFGQLESANGGREAIAVVGWVVDPDRTAPLEVEVRVDGSVVGRGRADRPRPDVEAVYPGYGRAHGFEIEVPAEAGLRQVDVVALDPDGPEVVIGTRQAFVIASMRGRIDAVDVSPGMVRVSGWVVDDGAESPVEIDLVVDGEAVVRTLADLVRRDLSDILGSVDDRRGFDLAVAVSPGAHAVAVAAVDRYRGGATVEVDRRDVTVPSAAEV